MRTIVALLMVVGVVLSEVNPGLRIRVTDKFLEELKQLAQGLAEQESVELVKKIPTNALPGGAKVKGIRLQNKDFSKSDIKFEEPNKIHLTIVDASATLEADVEAGDNNGKLLATVSGLNMDVAIAFGRTETDHISLSKSICQVTIGSFAVTHEGLDGAPELIQYATQMSNMVKTMVPQMMCPQMEMMLVMATGRLGLIPRPTRFHVGGLGWNFDSRPVSDPKATADYLQFDLDGHMYIGEHQDDFHPAPLVDTSANDRHFIIFVSEAFIDQLFSELHKNGKTGFKIDKNGDAEYYAKAKQMVKNLSDKLGQAYNGNDDIELALTTIEVPHATLEADKMKVHLTYRLDLKVRPGAADEKDMSAKLTTDCTMTASFNKTLPDEDYPHMNVDFKVESLELSDVQGVEVADSVKAAGIEELKAGLQKYINTKLRNRLEKLNELIAGMKKRDALPGAGKIDNAYFKVHDKTLEFGFDYDIDAAKLVETIRRRASGGKGKGRARRFA